MSYLDHIKHCNSYSENDYRPFVIGGETMGWIKESFASQLQKWPDVFRFEANSIILDPALDSVEKRTRAVKPVVEALYQEGIIDSWVGEQYAVTHNYHEPARMLLERAAVVYFGVRGFGVHLNGLVQKADGVYVWVARRTRDKPFWPGKLDQMVAGGQPVGIGRRQNLIKESAEEANIPEALARKATFVSEISYRGETDRGMNVDTLFNYDLWLPNDFIPENTDGEVDEFILMPIEEVAELTDTTDQFKDNCNLVNIDLFLRRGLINDSHPDYQEIIERLYAPAS